MKIVMQTADGHIYQKKKPDSNRLLSSEQKLYRNHERLKIWFVLLYFIRCQMIYL